MTSPPSPRWKANPGTRQEERPALDPDYFRVDEQGLPDLVEVSAAAAERLDFDGLSRLPDGHWRRWFDKDEALVLARIAAVDVERFEANFQRHVGDTENKPALLRILGLAHRIDGWYRALDVLDRRASNAVHAHIQGLVRGRLGRELDWALEHFPNNGSERQRLPWFKDRLDPQLWSGRGNEPSTTRENGRRFDARQVFYSFLDAARQIKALANEQLAISLAGDSHEPSAALFLAFLQLYGTVQQRLNDFTPQHTDFYYHDCLHMAARPAQPDSVHLVCRRVPTADLEVIVPESARFVLRNASGQEIVYRANEALEVTPVQVAALHTFRLERDQLISPERELNYVTRAKAQRLPVAGDDAFGKPGRPYWQLFGGSTRRAGQPDPRDADLGFAIASPLLFLREGRREVKIQLSFADPADLDWLAADTIRKFAQARHPQDDLHKLLAKRELLEQLFSRFAEIDMPAGVATSTADHVALDKKTLDDMVDKAVARNAARELPQGDVNALRTLYSSFLVEQLLLAPDESTFFTLFGRVYRRWLLIDQNALGQRENEAVKAVLQKLAPDGPTQKDPDLHDTDGDRNMGDADRPSCLDRHPDDKGMQKDPDSADVLSCLRGETLPNREFLIGKFFRDLFDVSLTGPEAWFSPAFAFATSGKPSTDGAGTNLTIRLRLGPDAPPVVACNPGVHGVAWNTNLPAVRIHLKPGSTPFAYSLLADVVLREIRTEVIVSDAREAVLYNQLGRIDPSKPFQPFGPAPASGSYFLFGSDEVARKNITSLELQIDWGSLPQDSGGFGAYYRDYEANFRNEGFRVSTSILKDGQWEPRSGAGSDRALFDSSEDDRRLEPASRIKIDPKSLRNHFRPLRGAAAAEEFGFDLSTRGGFFKVSLTEPLDTFGHKEYPQVLARVVSASARRKRPLRLPNAPYTPTIERLTFRYEASGSMDLVQKNPVERAADGDQAFLIHPFGFEEIYPAMSGDSKGAAPRLRKDGNLFIGLAAERAPGRITLFFNLRDESARPVGVPETARRTSWFYLASNQWKSIAPAAVVSDSTRGFLTSGIVTLDVPQDIDRANTILSSDLFWLCLGADAGFEGFADLYGVQAQAMRATREPSVAENAGCAAPVPGTVAEPLASIPGLIHVLQMGDAFGGRAAEDQDQFKTRAGERLRHKNRASVQWDYERLVLEQFPNVMLVKCFPTLGSHASSRGPQRPMSTPDPGSVTLVVVPVPQPGLLAELRTPKLNAVDLDKIRQYVAERASVFARVFVRNASYERIQVQCTVRLKEAERRRSGYRLRQLNREITERLSPWRQWGARVRFGWSLRKQEVEAWIRELDYVEDVSGLSLLQVSEDDDRYFILGDSERVERDVNGTRVAPDIDIQRQGTLQARFPWSIAVPMADHAIELMAGSDSATARPSGIERLRIGATFIVGACDG